MRNLLKPVFILSLQVFVLFSNAQNVAINNDGSSPHSSAILDVKSGTKGLLIPRTSTTSRNAIVNPAKGLMLYDTTTSSFWFYNGSAWASISAGSNGWNLSGNTGINPSNNFIGTTDAQPLRLRVNNSWAGELHPTSGNIFLGVGAGKINTTGEGNTAIGEHSLFSNTYGNFSTAYGYYSLAANTAGYNNTALGTYALTSNNVGFSNTAIGRNALFANTSGIENTAIGEGALLNNTIGYANTGNGVKALFSNTEGGENTAIGYWTLYSNTTGRLNTAIGSTALYSNTTGSNNIAIGINSLGVNTTANYNTAIGANSLSANSDGHDNTATGYNALDGNTTGYFNSASGSGALNNNTTGYNNTANGYRALYSNITGQGNTANGSQVLELNITGSDNVAIGYDVLHNNNSGNFNTAIGYRALHSNTTGSYNAAIGPYALYNNTGGQFNIAIGFGAGTHAAAPNVYNTISIGNDDILNAYQNQAFIGNTSTGWIGGKVTWSTFSDARVKNTITEDVIGLDFIMRLRPVTYHVSNKAITALTGNKETPDFPGKYDNEKVKYTGFLAQEVEQAAKTAGYDFSGYAAPKNQWGLYTISYEQFVVPLVKAMQEQQVIIEQLQKEITRLHSMEERLAALEKQRIK